MPRPVEVSFEPTAVALEPNGDFGSRPSAVSRAARSTSLAAGTSGRPGSVAVGGAASTTSLAKKPVEAIRLAR